jgi:hypothetical protein
MTLSVTTRRHSKRRRVHDLEEDPDLTMNAALPFAEDTIVVADPLAPRSARVSMEVNPDTEVDQDDPVGGEDHVPRTETSTRRGMSGPKPREFMTEEEVDRRIDDRVGNTLIKVSVDELAVLKPSLGRRLATSINNKADGLRETVNEDDDLPRVIAVNSGNRNRARKLSEGQGVQANVLEMPSILTVSVKPMAAPVRRVGLYQAPVRIGPSGTEEPIIGVLDSGAEINALTRKYVDDNHLTMEPISDIASNSYTQDPIQFVGVVTETVWIGRHGIKQTFFVVPGGVTSQDLLLGLPFFQSTQLSFAYEGEKARAKMIIDQVRVEITVGKMSKDRGN